MNKVQLLLENKIDTEEFGTIYFPTVQDLIKYGDTGYDKLLLPFRITTEIYDVLFELSQEQKSKFKVFDLFFQGLQFDDTTTYQDILFNSLRFYFRVEPIFIEEYYCIRVGDKFVHRDNFDALADIIRQVSKIETLQMERPPKFENDVQRDIYEKITEGRKRKAQADMISYATIINVAMNGGNGYVSPCDISKMTVFQLMSRYEFIIQSDAWNINFDKYLAGADPKEMDLTHWIKKVKV